MTFSCTGLNYSEQSALGSGLQVCHESRKSKSDQAVTGTFQGSEAMHLIKKDSFEENS